MPNEYYIDSLREPLKGDSGSLHSLKSYFNRNEYYSGFGIPTPDKPKIVTENLLDKRFPFYVEFDEDKYASLLSFAGVKDHKIADNKVTFGTSNPTFLSSNVAGAANLLDNSLELRVDNFVKLLKGNSAKIDKKVNEVDIHNLLFNNEYNLKSEEESKRLDYINEKLHVTLLHEVHHLATIGKLGTFTKKGSIWIGIMGGVDSGLLSGFYVNSLTEAYYHLPSIVVGTVSGLSMGVLTSLIMYIGLHDIEPIEIAADRFAKKYKNDVRWKDIIRLTKKVPNRDYEEGML